MISIIVPTLNESQNIPKFLRQLKKIKFKYELIFVDDNSWDDTDNLIKKIKNVKFIKRKVKLEICLNLYLLVLKNLIMILSSLWIVICNTILKMQI